MNITENEFQYLNECNSRDIVMLLIDKNGMSLHKALETLYKSTTYSLMLNPKYTLFTQGPLYIYSLLLEELGNK